MIDHLVFFKFKPEVSPEQRLEVAKALVGLKGIIPGVRDITCGENFTFRSQGHQLGLLVRLTDKAALDTYQNHPAHQAIVVSMIRPFVENIMAVDYEVGT